MLSAKFQIDYPSLASGLRAMLGKPDSSGARDAQHRQAVLAELTILTADNAAFDALFASLWTGLEQSPSAVLKFGTGAYHHLGVGDEIRNFIGRLWSAAMAAWAEANQRDFLLRILREDRFFLFEALDFAPSIFRQVPVDAEFMASWVMEARKAVCNDLYQRGLWRCFENYARHQPIQALRLIEFCFSDSVDRQLQTVLARMLSWIRSSELEPTVQRELGRIESELRMGGAPDLRSVYLESWGYAAGTEALSEARALALRDELLGKQGEQLTSWTFVLAQVVGLNGAGWGWAYRELRELARRPMNATARGWVNGAALAGWSGARAESQVTRIEWADLFFSLPPIDHRDGNLWQHIEHTLVDLLEADPEAAKHFLLRLAAWSGKAWAERLEAEREHFTWLHAQLQQTGHAQSVVTALCFASARSARRVGVKMFEECHVPQLLPEAVANATAVQLELLVLQATLRFTDHRATARIHASVARRIDEVGGELADTFYDEVTTEAMNTHGYRDTLAKHADGHAKLLKCVAEANHRLDSTVAAMKSPALKMLVPGRTRAEELAMRRMGRLIQKGASKNSILEHICTTVPVLYGRTWRMLDGAGNLTAANEMTKSEVSMEMPRLETVTPERMRLRRLAASLRIGQLQHGEKDDE